jgi:site-specific DNA-cytosine methylase
MEGGNRQPFVIEEEPFIVASRGRNPENPSDRTPGAPTEQRLEPNFSGCTNTLTSVQKDNYVAEPIIYDDYNSKITKDQDAITTLTTNCGASAERNGVKILEPIVCEERKDEGLRFFKDEVVGTLRTIDACGDKRVIEPSVRWRIRKLTPKCCWRLMGFTDSDCDKAAQYVSNSALYKQAGNSIVTSCLIALFSALLIENGHKAEVWTKYILHFSDNK